MSYPRSLWGWKLRIGWGSLVHEPLRVKVAKIASGVVILIFSVGATLLFKTIFTGILKLEGIGPPLFWRTLSIAWGAVFVLLIVSNMITGIATLYRSPEIPFLIAHPLSYRTLFLSRWGDNLVYSSWSLMVLGIPLIVAWGWVLKVGIGWILGAFVGGVIPLIVIAAVLGSFFLMMLVWLARKTAPWVSVLMVLLAVGGGIGYLTYLRIRGVVVEGRARLSAVEHYLSQLGREGEVALFPGQWLTALLRSISQSDWTNSALIILLLSLTAVVWLRWLYLLSGRIYYPTWLAFGEISGGGGIRHRPLSLRPFSGTFLPYPWGPLIRKDLLQFIRTPSQWAQFLILVGFLLIYLLNLILVSRRFSFDHPYWRTLLFFLNFAFSGFVLATLAVRFIFPLISLEGKGFWVVKSSPVKMTQLFSEKFLLAFFVFSVLCETIVLVSSSALRFHHPLSLYTTFATFLMGLALTGLSIGLGAIYPDFKEENPMRIASTPGGVMTVLVSLIYVGLVVGIMMIPVREYFYHLAGRVPFPYGELIIAWVLLILVNLPLTLLPLRWGVRALERRDW